MVSNKSSLFFYTVLTNIRGAADSISKCKVMLFFIIVSLLLAFIVSSRGIMIKWRAMTHGKIDLLLKIAEFMRISNYNSIKSCTFAPLFGLTAG